MKTRFYEIDLLRFISAFLVVIFHYTYTGYMEKFAVAADFEQLREVTRYAYVGINYFFIISGFVIFMSVADNSARHFVFSRFTRLFPAYWAALLVTTLVTLLWGGEVFTVGFAQFVANLTMLNQVIGYKPIDSAYWTLFIELKFYAVILVVLLLGWMRHFQHIIAISLLASTAALFHPWAQQVDMFVAIFPHWSGYFAAGGVFYLIKRDGASYYRIALLLLSYVFVIKQSTLFGALMSRWFNIEFDALVITTINSLFFAIFCVIAFCKTNPLRQSWCYYLGVLTYPLYLIHQHIGYMLINTFNEEVNLTLLVLLITVIAVMLSIMIHFFVEKPAARWLKARYSQQVNQKSETPCKPAVE
ncbi:acyltransferase [Psychrobium sp. 1_MG-2023]|uniref:acyltransferase family protein n=1 Tax=Psychrobium sp. 1_MG-2023 TaxID=3062624 RepID=UPI000C3272F4|nr:acyltransferase [Psychrobium sp. 1_MG-2023]MDP2561729.1 acyltransferase [Psychrobium sp. 1_MG-2023]PKF59782.1 acyltransferase [Alteromonadales bacterium alter-6D02]